MSLNYDPDGIPEFNQEEANRAKELGLIMVCIICDERESDGVPVSFIAYVSVIPRLGDGSICKVTLINHKIMQKSVFGINSLMPNVYAVKVNPD
jgi:hypothetical protein